MPENRLFTRHDYMTSPSSSANHRRYYSQYVTPQIIAAVVEVIGAVDLLASTDPHLNDIPLARWDKLANYLGFSRRMWDELGDTPSLAGKVCILKEAAMQWKERPTLCPL